MAKKSLDELYNEYGQLAAQHGDLAYQVGRYQFRMKQLQRSMGFTQKEIGKLQGKNPSAANEANPVLESQEEAAAYANSESSNES